MIDSDLETTLRRIEIKRLFMPENQELSIVETAGLAQRFLDEYATGQDLRHLNVSIKLIDRIEAIGGSAQLIVPQARQTHNQAHPNRRWPAIPLL